MDERVLRLRVGIVVLVAAIIAGVLVNYIGDMRIPGRTRYTLYAVFPYAPGVAVDTPVRKSGVTIGRVTDVELLPEGGVRITASVDQEYRVYENEIVRISTASVLGDAVLEFVPAREITSADKPLLDGTEIENGQVMGNPAEVLVKLETDVRSALRSMEAAGNEVQQMARNLNTAMANSEDQVPRIMQKAERSLDQFSHAMAAIDEVFGDPQFRRQLQEGLQTLPQTLTDARATLVEANKAFVGFQKVSERAERNLENLEQFTKPLGERGEQLVQNLDGSLANVNELLEQLVAFSQGLNTRQGTIGRLLHDPELADRLDRVLANAEDITFRLRPIMDDVRVFTDKIARDPRQLGVKGALDRRPSGAGSKGTGMWEPTTTYFDE